MAYEAAIGMAIGGLLGGAASGGLSYASALQQQEAQKDAFQHRYQWTRRDLELAGYNPMLAVSQGPGSVGNMSQAQPPDLTSALQAASQIRLQNTQADLNANSAREAKVNADIAEAIKSRMDSNPGLYTTAAESKVGINPSTAVGVGRGLFERGRNYIEGSFNSAKSVTSEPPVDFKRITDWKSELGKYTK